ncbi:hypothetical protein CLOM_g19168, partial [Closterium sp. NIES-68]
LPASIHRIPWHLAGKFDPAAPSVAAAWARLQHLPPADRLHTALLPAAKGRKEGEGGGGLVAADVRTLRRAQREQVVERALGTVEADNEAFLQKLARRADRAGLQLPSVEVRFEHLQVQAAVYVGGRAQPSLPNSARNALASALRALRLVPDARRPYPILNGCSGVLRPGRMTLLLGPPGAGKSTLLQALAGCQDQSLKMSGSVTYNGHALGEFVPERTAAYVPQTDEHIGELTVRETLDFSARLQGPGLRKGLVAELDRREAERGIVPDAAMDAAMKAMAVESNPTNVITDYVLQILGLDVCADTVVGNGMLRGISGGQKKRVSTGEALVGGKQVLLLDEISTGLDSSTTFLITRCLRHLTHLHRATTLVALLQPAPETYTLFDDVLLLSEGHVVFHGPREAVLPFFRALGFHCPARKGEADFLQEVTSIKDQGQYWSDATHPHHYVPAVAFEAAFNDTHLGKAAAAHLSVPYPREKSPPGALAHERYALPPTAMVAALLAREWALMRRNGVLYAARTVQTVLLALAAMTVFLRCTLHVAVRDGAYYLGALFFALLMMLFNGLSEMALLTARLPVFYRHRAALLYPAWAWVAPMALLSLPFSAWASALWAALTYYTIGFAPEPGRFFLHLLLLFLLHQTAIALFRLVAALARSTVLAATVATCALVLLVLLGGFLLDKADIHSVWVWLYWLSPLMYAQTAISVNEFLAPRWNVSAGPLFPPSATMGQVVLESRSLATEGGWRGIGVAVLLGYIVLFNLLTTLALTYLHPWGRPHPGVSEEQLEAKHAARTGEVGGLAGGSEKRSRRQRKGTGSALDQYCSRHTGSRDVESQLGSEEGQHGMVLPFEPHSLSFHNVSYFVDMPADMRTEGAPPHARLQLLRCVSGAFHPGVLTALMGVSGAGKTTLMDVLAGRKTGGFIEGDVRVSGFPKVHETFARVAGYCEQSDIHTPQVTVHESLLFSAWLRLPADVGREVREEFVEEVMALVELDGLRGAMVGLPGVNGLSVEQRKRLTIAVELVANPSIIFMDEPTSGLDARAAAIVMRTVRNTVDTGRTVVCTIHQPSIDIFEAFDELLLMKRGGEVIYMGPLGTDSKVMIDYFQAIPGMPPISDSYNPATWMLDISTPAMADKLGLDFADIFCQSDQFRRNEALILSLSTPAPGQHDLSFATQYPTSYAVQFVANLWKRARMYWRAPDYNAVRYLFTAAMALLIGGVYWGLGQQRATQQQVLNVMGALYTAALFVGWNNAASVQPIVAVERTVFYRERAAGLYSSLPYALAQGAIEVPYVVVQTAVYSLITFSMIHFEWTAGKFWWYALFMFLTLLYFTCYGLMAIAVSPNEQLAMVLSSSFFSTWNLLCGFLITRPQIPVWWRWFYWIDPVAWTLYGLNVAQLGDVTTTIQVPGMSPDPTVQGYLEEVFGYQYSWLGYVVLALAGFVILFFSVFTFALRRFNFQNR